MTKTPKAVSWMACFVLLASHIGTFAAEKTTTPRKSRTVQTVERDSTQQYSSTSNSPIQLRDIAFSNALKLVSSPASSSSYASCSCNADEDKKCEAQKKTCCKRTYKDGSCSAAFCASACAAD